VADHEVGVGNLDVGGPGFRICGARASVLQSSLVSRVSPVRR